VNDALAAAPSQMAVAKGWCLGQESDRFVPPISFYKSLAANKKGPPSPRGFVATPVERFPERLPVLTGALSARVTAQERYQHPLEKRHAKHDATEEFTSARAAFRGPAARDADGTSFGLDGDFRKVWRAHMRTEVDKAIFGHDQDASDEMDVDVTGSLKPRNDFWARLENPHARHPLPPEEPTPQELRRRIRMLRARVQNERVARAHAKSELDRHLIRQAFIDHKLHHETHTKDMRSGKGENLVYIRGDESNANELDRMLSHADAHRTRSGYRPTIEALGPEGRLVFMG